MTIQANDLAIEVVTENRMANTTKGSRRIWGGFLTYQHKPIMRIGGLEFEQTDVKTGEVRISIALSEDERHEEYERSEFGFFDKRSFEGVKDNVPVTYTTIGSRKFNWMSLAFPVSGFMNLKENGFASCKMRFAQKDYDYVTSEIGVNNYLSNDRTPPLYCLEDTDYDMSDVLEEFAAMYPEYTEWHAKWFPASRDTAADKEKLDRRAKLMELAQKKKPKSKVAASPAKPAAAPRRQSMSEVASGVASGDDDVAPW